jgi:hypothetical protein
MAIAEIPGSDESGNNYILHDDGTWITNATVSADPAEVAEKAVKIFFDYKAEYEKTVPEEVAACVKTTISENANSDFEKITFPLSQKWDDYQKWVTSVSIVNGKATTADLINGFMFIAATQQVAISYGYNDQ